MSDTPKALRVLNLGAGVQSTVVALMIHKGHLPPIDCAIFADTGEEPGEVYHHLAWLKAEVAASFPIHTVTAGRLGDGLASGRTNSRGHTTIPAFTPGGGKLNRKCTADYKIDPIERFIRRGLLGIKPRCRVPKGVLVTQLFGLSFEEMGRAARVKIAIREGSKYCVPQFPLIEREMKRGHCLRWLKDYGVPHEVERSACVFCPYKSDREWQRLKLHDSAGWARAVEVDELLRTGSSRVTYGMKNPMFLHRSCQPIGEVDFTTPEERGEQPELSFVGECTGMCGL